MSGGEDRVRNADGIAEEEVDSMTAVKCGHCGQFWTINTRHPENHPLTSTLCPTCIPMLPVVNLDTRRSA